jgi:hypothetical protein
LGRGDELRVLRFAQDDNSRERDDRVEERDDEVEERITNVKNAITILMTILEKMIMAKLQKRATAVLKACLFNARPRLHNA